MEKIYSNIEPSALISVIIRAKDLSSYRLDGCPTTEYIQVCGRKLSRGTKVAPHKHIPLQRESLLTQEVWIILRGAIKASFYDLDNSFLFRREIQEGDCIVLLRGGHSLESLEEGTLFYEIKNGPYYSAEADKENINA